MPRPARAVILPVILFVLVLLGLLGAMFSFRIHADVSATRVIGERLQTRLAAEAGIEAVKLMLRTARFDRTQWYDNPDAFHRILVWAHGADRSKAGTNEEFKDTSAFRFSIVADDPTDDKKLIRFGITDEASKLNLNTATDSQLLKLVTAAVAGQKGGESDIDPQAIVDAIIDWRDADSKPTGGAGDTEGDYYRSLEKPYRVKNGPFSSVEELLLVKGVTGQVLFGEDFDRNGLLTPNEDDGDKSFPPDNQDGVLNRGIYPYLTVASYDSNTANDNSPRIYLFSNEATLGKELEDVFPGQTNVIHFITAVTRAGPGVPGSGGKPTGSGGKPPGGAAPPTGGQGSGAKPPAPAPGGGKDGTNPPTSPRPPGSTPPPGPKGGPKPMPIRKQQALGVDPNAGNGGPAAAPPSSGGKGGKPQPPGPGGAPGGTGGSPSGDGATPGADGSGQTPENGGDKPGSSEGGSEAASIRSPASLLRPRKIGPGQEEPSPLTLDQLPLLMDRLTTRRSQDRRIPGLINVNTAPRQVLACLGELNEEQIKNILALRDTLDAKTLSTPAWLVTEGVLDLDTFDKIASNITSRSQQFTIESLGYGDHIGMVTRLQVVVDMVGPIAQTIYYRDLSYLGGSYPIREEDKEQVVGR